MILVLEVLALLELPSNDFLPDEPGVPLHDGTYPVLYLCFNSCEKYRQDVDMMYQRNCVEIPAAVHFGADLLTSKRVEKTKI
jgi:hypothetical protein